MRVAILFHVRGAFCNKFHGLNALKCPSDVTLQHQEFLLFSLKVKVSESTGANEKVFYFQAKFTKVINLSSMHMVFLCK